MFKQLKTTLKMTFATSLLLQLGVGYAWSQTKTVSVKSNSIKNYRPSNKTISTSPTSSQLSFKPNMNRAQKNKYAYYKRAETLAQTASLSVKDTSDEKIVSGSFSIAQSQSMIDHKDGTKYASRTYIGAIDTKLPADWNLSTRISFSQDLRDVENPENGFSDLSFGVGQKPTELVDWLKGSKSFSIALPTSKYSQKYQNLQASVGAGYRFALTPVVLAKGFDASLSLRVSRNFHQYETDVSGRILNQYSLRETVSGSYTFKDFSFSADLMFRHGWNYAGSTSQAFEHTEEIGYSITPRWGLSVGHTNSGAWLKPNGQDSNLSLIDEEDSIVYVSTSVSF